MNSGIIGVFDSGIGGLSVLRELDINLKNKTFIYFGDNVNAPYGNKSIEELKELALNVIKRLSKFRIDALVVACNTLSLNLMDFIRENCNVPVFGVFPPIEKGVKRGKTLLIGTNKTCEKLKSIDKYVSLQNENKLKILPMPTLATQIEDKWGFVNDAVNLEELSIYKGQFEVVILGCTHYFFAKNEILDHLKPLLALDGINLTVNQVSKIYKNLKSLEKIKQNQILFIGENKIKNQIIYQNLIAKSTIN